MHMYKGVWHKNKLQHVLLLAHEFQIQIHRFHILSKINLILNLYSSVKRQKRESQNRCFKKTKHAKFPEKQTFLTPVRISG